MANHAYTKIQIKIPENYAAFLLIDCPKKSVLRKWNADGMGWRTAFKTAIWTPVAIWRICYATYILLHLLEYTGLKSAYRLSLLVHMHFVPCDCSAVCNARSFYDISMISVCLSVCQTRALWQNKIIVRKYINIIRQSDVSSFLGPNFVALSLGVHSERVC